MAKGWACIARLGGIGDNLVAGSPCRPLKRLGYNVEMLTSGMASCVFLNNPFIDKLSVKQEGEIPGGDNWHIWFASRAGEYDLLVNLSNSMETRHAAHKSNTHFWWPQDYRRVYCGGSYLETAHDIVGVAHEFGPLFFPTEEERDRAERTRADIIGGPYITWILAGSRLDKIYPWTTHVICRILSELKVPVVLIGVGPNQFQMAQGVQVEVNRANSNERGLHLAMSPDGSDPGGHQHWGIRRSLTQALTGSLVVTPDTGAAWACAFEDMPKIVMTSHASPENITKHWKNCVTLHADPYRVPCSPCHRLHDDMSTCVPASKELSNVAACMADISVASVMETIERQWIKPKPKLVHLEAAE